MKATVRIAAVVAVLAVAISKTPSGVVEASSLGDAPHATDPPPARSLQDYPPTATAPPPKDCYGRARDMDSPGSDIGSQYAYNDFACEGICTDTPGCLAWTWSNTNGGSCWLKGGQGSATFYGGAVSGIRVNCRDQRGSKYVVVTNCDAAGNDNGNFLGRSYWDCMKGANAFTWSVWNGGTCWLKTRASQCQYAPNKFTGVLVW